MLFLCAIIANINFIFNRGRCDHVISCDILTNYICRDDYKPRLFMWDIVDISLFLGHGY